MQPEHNAMKGTSVVILVTVLITVFLWQAFLFVMHRDRRSLFNALLLGLALFAASMSLWVLIGSILSGSRFGSVVLGGVATLLTLMGLTLPFAFIVNGIYMLGRERRGVANSVALLTGLSLLVLFLLPIVFALSAAPEILFWMSIGLVGIASYLGVLFASYLTYGWLYGRLGLSKPVDAIAVLGSGLVNGKVSPLLASRLDKALEVYQRLRDDGHPVILVPTGGQGPDEPITEGEAMTDYLLARGVPSEHLLTEDRARTTRQNISNTRTLLLRHGLGTRLAIVTNDYHTLRAAVLSRVLHTDAEVVGSSTSAYFLPSALLREFVALLVSTRWWHLTIAMIILIIAFWLGRVA